MGLMASAGAVARAGAGSAQAAEPQRYDAMVARGIEYLRTRGQAADGAFSGQAGTGVTSLCVAAILAHEPAAVADPVVRRALEYLEANTKPDGGIYATGSRFQNYETCLAIFAISAANRDGRYDGALERAERFVRGIQWDESEGLESSDVAYGGAGYGSTVRQRPDLSNTSFLVEALKELGADENDEAIQKALLFVSRCQNLEGPHNTTEFAAKVDDGGFYYTPAAGGQSQAGKTPSGGLRSYGSMTYAGLKSMIFAGVDQSDPRVRAAMEWIRQHYTLEQNPGMGAAGLYYYYHTFAKALDAAGVDTLADAQGREHDWRQELRSKLAASQQPDGSWTNEQNPRWMEGDANLVTGYALLALKYLDPDRASGEGAAPAQDAR